MASPYRPLPPGVRRFRLDPARYRSVASRAVVRRSALGAFLASPLLAGAALLRCTNVGGLAVVCAGAAVIVVFLVIRKLVTLGNALAPELQRYELILSDRVLRRSTGVGPVAEVLRAEVSEIVETGAGLWVSCMTPRRSLFVSSAVDGYADVRSPLSAWGRIKALRGWQAVHYARREARHQGPRDAILGTALASDGTLAAELEAVRMASAQGFGEPGATGVTPRAGRSLEWWIAGIILFLAVWQVLQPGERRQVVTDQTCRERPSCKGWGLCKASDYRCIAGTDEDCLQSEACTKLGRCKRVGGACYGENDREGPAPSQ